MKRLYSLLFMSFLLTSCASKFYTYDIQMDRPEPSENMRYENDTMSIAFHFFPKFIGFEIQNKLDDGIRINWDEISLSVNGQAKRIVHTETGMSKTTETQPPTTIPPKAKLKDALIATDKLTYVSGKVAILDAYPKTDYGNKKIRARVKAMNGEKIILYFPYYLRNAYHSKTFEFTITDIHSR